MAKNNIENIIQEKGLKVTDVIKHIGISKSYYYDIVNFKSEPSLKIARKISSVLQEDIDTVFPN